MISVQKRCGLNAAERVVVDGRRAFCTSTKWDSRTVFAREKQPTGGHRMISQPHALGRRFLSRDSTTPTRTTKKRIVVWSAIASLSVIAVLDYFMFLRHVERAPQTGRWRKMNIRPEKEIQLGEEAYKSLVDRYHDKILPDNHPVTGYVRGIVEDILKANNLGTVVPADAPVSSSSDPPGANEENSSRKWRLAVVADDKIVNSTASSGGIVVFTGLLLLCRNEHEVAAILGHEIAHVVARHLAERYSRAKDWHFKQVLYGTHSPGPELLQKSEEKFRENMAINLHDQELEADAIGLQLSARACFDPRAAIDVNQRLAILEEKFQSQHPEYKPTHPRSAERIQHLERALPKELLTMSKDSRCSERLNTFREAQHYISS